MGLQKSVARVLNAKTKAKMSRAGRKKNLTQRFKTLKLSFDGSAKKPSRMLFLLCQKKLQMNVKHEIRLNILFGGRPLI